MTQRAGRGAGIDLGATLTKLAIRRADGEVDLELVHRGDIDRVVARVESARCDRIGLTGGGASRAAPRLPGTAALVDEFEAWARGSRELLRKSGGEGPGERYLLTSLGTGTSAVLVDGPVTRRVAGTALGGGTITGLGGALTGCGRFDELARLARRGSRAPVDLLLADVYPDGDGPLPGEASAAFFAKLAPRDEPGAPDGERGSAAAPADVAHGLMNLVGWELGLLSGALAAAQGCEWVVYGGSVLRDNEVLATALRVGTAALGRRPRLLEHGEFAGALGALHASES